MLLAAILLASCGLETVEYLAPPTVPYYQDQVSPYWALKMTHEPTNYTGTNFQGYEVYYKVYPQGVNPATNLAQDKGLLDASPTRDRLVTLGYQRLNGTGTSSTAEPLVDLSSSGTSEVLLDFEAFFASSTSTFVEPELLIGGASQTEVFRTSTVAGVQTYPSFSDLYDPSPTGSDISGAVTESTFEIDVFLVAYSFTPEKTIYSQPVAWGILKP